MALIDLSLPASIAKALRLPTKSPRRQQIKVLRKLLKKARFTEFGQEYRFDDVLLSRHPGKKFNRLFPHSTIPRFTSNGGIVLWRGIVMYAGQERLNTMH